MRKAAGLEILLIPPKTKRPAKNAGLTARRTSCGFRAASILFGKTTRLSAWIPMQEHKPAYFILARLRRQLENPHGRGTLSRRGNLRPVVVEGPDRRA